MNPDVTMPGQPQQQPAQDDAQANAAIENKYVMETAKQLVADELANPGSQDPDALKWARSKVTGNPVDGGNAPIAQQQQQPQSIQPQPVPQPPQPPSDTLHVRHDDDVPQYQGGDQGTITRNGEQ